MLDHDLAARPYGEQAPPRITRVVRSQTEMPSRLFLRFIDRDLGHASNVVIAQIQGEEPKDVHVNVNMVMTRDHAKTLADRLLYLERLGRVKYTVFLPRPYLQYDPGDVLMLDIDGSARTYIITDMSYDPRGVVKMVLSEHDPEIFSYSAVYTPSPPRTVDVVAVPETTFYVLDCPLVSANHGGLDGYVLAVKKAGWSGAQYYRSFDEGATYEAILRSSAGGFAGTVYQPLEAADPAVMDWAHTIRVYPVSGCTATLESTTSLALFNGANTALLGGEMIRFLNAHLQPDGSYILSGLQRGVRGTEHAIGTHGSTEAFYLLSNAVPAAVSTSLGRTVMVKALSLRSTATLGSVPAQYYTPTGNSLLPFSPVHLRGERNAAGDITIRWRRRSRKALDWRGVSEIPLGEAEERYQVHVLDAIGAIRRTITVSSPEAIYTAAEQVADFGSTQPSVRVAIYQVSADVGIGHPAHAIL